jgi:pSer/pThr/pTyr-binding forkhead associated (FHA) protein
MTDKEETPAKRYTADWFMRGALGRLGDSLDRLTGRNWSPSSSLTASELTERINKLLDSEAIEVPGKGKVVPHDIKLKMQWDKFSDDVDDALKPLENELLAAAVDHINDSLYYTFAPVTLELKPDYFIEGVKLSAGFGEFAGAADEREMNVTVPSISVSELLDDAPAEAAAAADIVTARFRLKGTEREETIEFPARESRSLGRSGSNDLVIDDASVSKIHASLTVSPDGVLLVADTGSTNGTFVNGERIAYGKAVGLTAEDKVTFGQVDVVFEVQQREPAAEDTSETAGDTSQGQVVEIDGFEFKSRTTAKDEGEAETEPEASEPRSTSDQHAVTEEAT